MASDKQPKLISYASRLYEVMREAASSHEAPDGAEVLVWRGRLVATCTANGIPEGYYKKVVDVLRSLGCIEMLEQGRRGSRLTSIALHHPPTPELYADAIVKSGWEGLTRRPSPDRLAAQVEDVKRQTGGINIVEAFKEVESRLQSLETAVEALQQGQSSQQQDS